jgi:HK97 family phage major capsid protein/HK97 family phage prohead protease
MGGLERRANLTALELRAAGAAGPMLVGYASVWNALSEDLGGFKERVAKGAFAGSVGGDVRAFWNHNRDLVLGRTTAGTLRLAEDDHGLRVEIDPPASAAAFVEAVQRGDVNQMSMGFFVGRDQWEMVQEQPIRTLLEVQLVEVSVVALPAYPATEIGLRERYGELPEIPESIRRAPVEKTKQGRARARLAGGLEVRAEAEGKTKNVATVMEMRQQAARELGEAKRLDATANAESRLLTEEERGAYDQALAESKRLLEAAQRAEDLEAANPVAVGSGLAEEEQRPAAPNVLRHYKRGDNEARAMAAYIRRGDAGGILSLRAAVDSTMNITTPADGGYAVPTGHYNQIITKRNEQMLAPKLGVRQIVGRGTTVNAPTETGTTEPATSTAEETAYTRDALQLGPVAFALVKYTVKIDITEELEEDEDSNLLTAVEDYAARAFALQHNQQLCTAALAVSGGGTIVALTGVAAAAADITTLMYALPDYYADGAKFLMRRATEGAYRALQGSQYLFAPTPAGSPAGAPSLWAHPVFNSGYVPAVAASAKCVLFGDWNYMGLREGRGVEVLRDPYSQDGRVLLKYRQRFVYKLLLPSAILIGQRAAS